MTSTRPYLLHALYDWIIDNGLTPQILIDAMIERVQVPQQYVEDERIVLNIAPDAVRDLDISNDFLRFNARFAGKPQQVCVPVNAVLAIYARENGRGMLFPEEEVNSEADNGAVNSSILRSANKSHLKVIK